MSDTRWDHRFRTSTRGQIVSLLRREPHTVDELAQALELTGNGVRSHLATLERDGLVEQRGARRGAGKPAHIYDLTPEAEHLFPKAYAAVLNELIALLVERMGSDDAKGILRDIGRRIAGEPGFRGGIDGRLDAAVEVMNQLGGFAESEVDGETVRILSYSCPLTSVSAKHCEICQLGEALVTEIVGLPMKAQCQRSPRPRCCFEGTIIGSA